MGAAYQRKGETCELKGHKERKPLLGSRSEGGLPAKQERGCTRKKNRAEKSVKGRQRQERRRREACLFGVWAPMNLRGGIRRGGKQFRDNGRQAITGGNRQKHLAGKTEKVGVRSINATKRTTYGESSRNGF